MLALLSDLAQHCLHFFLEPPEAVRNSHAVVAELARDAFVKSLIFFKVLVKSLSRGHCLRPHVSEPSHYAERVYKK